MQLPFFKPSFSKLFFSQLTVTVISVSLLPLATSCTLVNQSKGVETKNYDLQSQQRQHKLKESKISQLIEILEQKSRLYELKGSPEALAASQELVEIGKPAVPELINAFSKNRIFLTFGVAETLLKIAQKDSSVVPILINKLGDKDLQVRFGAMKVLENDSFVPELKKAAQNKNPRIAAGAIYTLGKVAADSSILPYLNSKNSLIRISTELALRDKTPEIFINIENALEHEDVFIRVNSASILTRSIGYIKEIAGVIDFDDVNKIAKVLVEGVENKDSSIRFSAVQAFPFLYRIRYLYEIKPNPPLIPSIIKLIKDEDPGVACMAMFVISEMGNTTKAAIPLLLEELDSKDERVRGAAALAFRNMGSDAKPAIPKIIAISQNKQENQKNRLSALRSLGNLKKNAVSAIPALINTIEDKQNSKSIVLRAAGALQKIDSLIVIPYLVNNISEEDKSFRATWLSLLWDAANEIESNKNNLSQAELEKAISDLETALETVENSEHEIPQHIASTLRRSIAELKK